MSRKIQQDLEIINRLGLHARAATLFVQVATTFSADISVTKDGEKVDGKSIIGLMMLAAGKGSSIEIEVCGDDADNINVVAFQDFTIVLVSIRLPVANLRVFLGAIHASSIHIGNSQNVTEFSMLGRVTSVFA